MHDLCLLMFRNRNLFGVPWIWHCWCCCPFSKTISDVSPGSVSWALYAPWLWAPVCNEASPLLSQSLLQCSLGLSWPFWLPSSALYCHLLNRLAQQSFHKENKRGSHGWPISAFLFNSVVKHCWLTGLVSTVYKKVLCNKSPFSHRPVWHQCWDDLLLESLIAQFCHCSVWVSLATSLSCTEPKISHCAGGKSVCRHVFLFNEFSGWSVCSSCRCHYWEPTAGRQCAPFPYFHRQSSLWGGCPCVIVNWAVAVGPIILISHGTLRVSSSTENGLCSRCKVLLGFLGSLLISEFLSHRMGKVGRDQPYLGDC